MVVKAHGKINLSLDITGRRSDGYHYISTLMQQVELCDFVTVRFKDTKEICVKTDCPQIPDGKDNLAYRACAEMTREFGIDTGFDIFIEKHIPIAGGMAGGSADAAAVITAVNSICKLNVSLERQMAIGLRLGADVPFCLQKKPALGTGIGEVLTPVPGLSEDLYILLVNPKKEISTKAIYESIDQTCHYGRVDTNKLICALDSGDLSLAARYMQNVMQPVSAQQCGEILTINSGLLELGAIHAMMTGSGATCFGIFKEKPEMERVKKMFPNFYVALTKPLSHLI